MCHVDQKIKPKQGESPRIDSSRVIHIRTRHVMLNPHRNYVPKPPGVAFSSNKASP